MDTGQSSSAIGWGTGVDEEAPSFSSRPVANPSLPNGHRPPSSDRRSTPRDQLPNGHAIERGSRSGRRDDTADRPPLTNGDGPHRGDHRPPYHDHPPAQYPPYDDRPPSSHYNDRPPSNYYDDRRPSYTDPYHYNSGFPPHDSAYPPRPAYDYDPHYYPPHPPSNSSYPPYDDRPPSSSSYYDSRPPPPSLPPPHQHQYGGGSSYPPRPPQPTRPSAAHTYRDPTTEVRDMSNVIIVPGFEGGFADEAIAGDAAAPVANTTTTTTSVTAPSPSPMAPSVPPGSAPQPHVNPSSQRHHHNEHTSSKTVSRRSGRSYSNHSDRRTSRRGGKSERRSSRVLHVVGSSSHQSDSGSRSSSKTSPSCSHRRNRDRDQTLGFPRFNGQLPRRGGARPFVQVAVGDVEEVRKLILQSSSSLGRLPAESTHTILYGRYKLMGALGKGVSSIVIKAEDMAWTGDGPDGPTSDLTSFDHRYVAIKVFRGSKIYDTACREEAALLKLVSSFSPESGTSSSSCSPSRGGVAAPTAQYVLPLLRHIPHPSHSALVFPVAGPTLFHCLQRSLLQTAGLPVSDVIAILHQLLTSLAHMHARGVVHTDIKPENIVLVLPPFESEDGSGRVVVYEGGPLPMQHLMVCGNNAEEQVAARLRTELVHLENDIKAAQGKDDDDVPPLMEELGQGWSDDSYHDQSPKAAYKLCKEILESHDAGKGIGFRIPRFVQDAGVPRCEVRVIDLGNSRTGGCDASGAGPRRKRRVEHLPTPNNDGDVETTSASPPSSKKKTIELTEPHQLVRSTVPWFPAYPSDVIQTSHYRAPEVMLGADWDARVDVWSVGCLVTELLSGVELFHCCESDVDHLALIEHVLTHNKNDTKSEAVRIFPTSFYNRDTCLDFSKFFSSRHSSSEDGPRLRLREPIGEKQRASYPSLSERFSERAGWSYRTPTADNNENNGSEVTANDVAVDAEGEVAQMSNDHQKLKLLFGLTRSLLNVDPTTRLSAAEALNHPIFADL